MPTPLAAIPDGGACAVDQRQPDGSTRAVILLRRGGQVWAYINRCPHFSLPLDFEPGEFATYDGRILMCAHHSAMFRYEDGVCIEGPCAGHRLDAVEARVAGALVRLGSEPPGDVP
ncbi:MAG TPA: Rieske 2Fe-2S domain-containing protein [Burkholderiaceae bacterium]|nr:Rieske 2Fe-2S domain-containing protein [Burkholderiaceae bacterium]